MKRGFVIFSLAVLGLSAWSQQEGAQGLSDADAQRQRIANARVRANAELSAQELSCQSKFAVTDCMREVGRRRIQMMSEFKRQEAVLNDAQRRQRGVEQVQRTEVKAAERARRDADLSSSPGGTQDERQKAHDDKVRQHPKPSVPASAASGDARAEPAAVDREGNRAAHAQKVEAAKQRRLERDERLKERAAGTKTLPVPP